MESSQEQTQVNALKTFCHAIPREDGSIDQHQPYMGVVSITVFRGKKLPNVNILANTIIELRCVQPGINYPVMIARFRNGSLKEFQSGKRLFTVFNTQGNVLEFTDHFGKGFHEFINQKVIEGLLAKIPETTENGKKPNNHVLFTVDTNGTIHKLSYPRFEQELTENAALLTDEAGYNSSGIDTTEETHTKTSEEAL